MCGQQHAPPPFIHSKSRMRKRARTDLRGGRSAMVVPTATVGGWLVDFWVPRDPLRMANSRQTFMTQALARADPRHNYNVELLYRRRTRRACSLFQRLALPQRLLLHFAKLATALTILKSSVCQNDSFWRATSGSRGSTEPGTRPWQVSLGLKLTTSVRVCPWRRSRKIGLVRFLD